MKREFKRVSREVADFMSLAPKPQLRGKVYKTDRIMGAIKSQLGKWSNTPHAYDAELKCLQKKEVEAVLRKNPLNQLKYRMEAFDCVACYERVVTTEGLKNIGDLVVGDRVLSYNFPLERMEYKPITTILEKGKRDIFRAFCKGGQVFDVTENHPMIVRTSYGTKCYKKVPLREMNLAHDFQKRIPIAIRIPNQVNDSEWLTENLCFVAGHYVAEGWKAQTAATTSGKDCPAIAQRLTQERIPYTYYNYANRVPTIYFRSSPFRRFLLKLKNNSHDIHLLPDILQLPPKKLRAFLGGYFLGDGHTIKSKFKEYSTISPHLKNDLIYMYLRLGKPLYSYEQKNHQGLGKTPIWRVRHNPHSCFGRQHLNDLSNVSVRVIERRGQTEVRDISVADNRNFFLSNGVLLHNCDDFAWTLKAAFCIEAYRRDEVNPYCVGMITGRLPEPHAMNWFLDDSLNLWLIEPQTDKIMLPTRDIVKEVWTMVA